MLDDKKLTTFFKLLQKFLRQSNGFSYSILSSTTVFMHSPADVLAPYLVKQLRKFYRTGSFITVFTKAHRWISSTSSWIETRHRVRMKSIKRSKTSLKVGGYVPKKRNIGPDNAERSSIFPHNNQNWWQSVNNMWK